MARSPMSYVSSSIAGSQPSKFDFWAFPSFCQLNFCSKLSSLEVPGCQNSFSRLRRAELSLKCPRTASSSKASDWENCAPRMAPASLQIFTRSQTGRHSAFCFSWELLKPSWGPPHDRAENGSFSNVLCQQFNSRIVAVEIRFAGLFQAFVSSISAPDSARIWPRRAVSQWSQKGIFIAGPRALKWHKFASKKRSARSWP